MKTLTALRRVEKDTHTLTNIQTQLQRHGYQPQLRHPLPDMRYLRFHGQFEDLAEMTGLLDLGSWANSALPDLDGIDWVSVENQVLCQLIAEHPLHLALSHQHAPFTQIGTPELITDLNYADQLPFLDASPGVVIIESFKPYVPHDVSEITTFNHLQVPLTFSIGYSILPCHALATIEIGDVLLIEHIEGQISSNGTTLFTSELTEEAIMVLEQTENEQYQHDTSTHAQEGMTGLNTLPIELSVVLMEKIVPLAQLKSITPGEIMELPQDAMLNVEIRANRHCFARGELIQLTNGQLGVEIRTLWPQE